MAANHEREAVLQDFLGFWEQLNNPNFKAHEFVYFKTNAGANSFNPSVMEWIEKTNARGIISKRGRYGGTYAHKDIAAEFHYQSFILQEEQGKIIIKQVILKRKPMWKN